MNEPEEVLRGRTRPEGAIQQRLGPVGDDLGRVEVVDAAQAVAFRTCAVGAVEGEAARLELGNVEPAIGARHGRGVELLVPAGVADQYQSIGQLQGLGHGGLKTLLDSWLEDDAIDHRFDGVVLALVKQDFVGKVAKFTVNAGAEALLVEFVEQVLELALAPADDRRIDDDALAGSQLQDALHDLFGRLAGDGPAAVGAVWHADGCVEQTQIIVDFGDGADGRAGASAGGLLLDGDGGAESFDRVHIGAFDLI